MLKQMVCTLLFGSLSLLAATPEIAPHPTVEQFREELGIELLAPNESKDFGQVCHIYIVHHGSTAWSEVRRLQGWAHLPLSEKGVAEVQALATALAPIHFSAIYSSSLMSAVETAEILQDNMGSYIPIISMDAFRNEFHGELEGASRESCKANPNAQFYGTLSASEEIFFAYGPGGESKADVARRAIPVLKEIAQEHPGENVIIVAHGGLFKVLNFYMGHYDHHTFSIPYGGVMVIEADGEHIYLPAPTTEAAP